MSRSIRIFLAVVSTAILGLVLAVCIVAAGNTRKTTEGPTIDLFPYRTAQFTHFLTESNVWTKPSEAHDFYAWMDKAYAESSRKFPGKEHMRLEELLRVKREQFDRIKDPSLKAENEIAFSAWVHHMVKGVIPRFSLDRGFEFSYVIKYGERQCFLQSTLIAGILQSVGFDAGVVMVFRNPSGEESNNGHAVVLLKMPEGHDIIVDASEPYPFYRPRGIFVKSPEYRYVRPVYTQHSSRIKYYLSEAGGRVFATTQIGPLDYGFVRSQFWYYRGERAKGALMASKPTSDGLAEAQKALEQSVKFCEKNPLSVYMLGRVYYVQGKREQAKQIFENAYNLYTRFGWIPPEPKYYHDVTARP